MQKLQFPKGFLWGVATSAYQVEGDCTNNDWYEWEKRGKTKDMAGKAGGADMTIYAGLTTTLSAWGLSI